MDVFSAAIEEGSTPLWAAIPGRQPSGQNPLRFCACTDVYVLMNGIMQAHVASLEPLWRLPGGPFRGWEVRAKEPKDRTNQATY